MGEINIRKQEYIVKRRRVDYGGGGACLLFFVIICIVFFWVSPLVWLWILLLFPLGGWGYGRVYYVPVNTVDPRSPRAGTYVDIAMKELKF